MWYSKGLGEKKEINYSRPIIAESKRCGNRYLLMPLKDNTYRIIGYDWFNLDTGEYNSNLHYTNAKMCVEMYEGDHLIYNVDIVLNKL